jgi:hypothetical protein
LKLDAGTFWLFCFGIEFTYIALEWFRSKDYRDYIFGLPFDGFTILKELPANSVIYIPCKTLVIDVVNNYRLCIDIRRRAYMRLPYGWNKIILHRDNSGSFHLYINILIINHFPNLRKLDYPSITDDLSTSLVQILHSDRYIHPTNINFIDSHQFESKFQELQAECYDSRFIHDVMVS